MEKLRSSKDIVLAAIDNAFAGLRLEPSPQETPEDSQKKFLDSIKDAGEVAKRAAEAESNRLAGIVGSLNCGRENLTKARRHHREIAASISLEDFDAIQNDIAFQYVNRWDGPAGIRANLLNVMAQYSAIKDLKKRIAAANDAALATEQKSFRDFIEANQPDLERLGLLQSSDLE